MSRRRHSDRSYFAALYPAYMSLTLNSTAALSFNDRQAAGELLSGFRVKRHIVTAILYSADGTVFAAYRRDSGSNGPAPQLRADGSWIENGQLVLFRQVILRRQPTGTVYLASDLGELNDRMKRFGWMFRSPPHGLGTVVMQQDFAEVLQRSICEPLQIPEPRNR